MQIFSLSAGGLQEQTVLLGEIRWLYQCKARGDVYLISDMATSEEEACLSVGAGKVSFFGSRGCPVDIKKEIYYY